MFQSSLPAIEEEKALQVPIVPPQPRIDSGEEAYLRRLAMSQPAPLSSSETGEEAFMHRAAMAQTGASTSVTPESAPSSAYNPFAPPLPQAIPPPAAPASADQMTFDERVKNSRNAAAAIAAKLKALAPPAGSMEPTPTPSPPVPATQEEVGSSKGYISCDGI